MKTLIPLLVIAALLPLAGCVRAYPAYSVQYGPWSNYDPYYEYGGYRRSDQPIGWYGPQDAPYRNTYYDGYYGGY